MASALLMSAAPRTDSGRATAAVGRDGRGAGREGSRAGTVARTSTRPIWTWTTSGSGGASAADRLVGVAWRPVGTAIEGGSARRIVTGATVEPAGPRVLAGSSWRASSDGPCDRCGLGAGVAGDGVVRAAAWTRRRRDRCGPVPARRRIERPRRRRERGDRRTGCDRGRRRLRRPGRGRSGRSIGDGGCFGYGRCGARTRRPVRRGRPRTARRLVAARQALPRVGRRAARGSRS